MPVAEARFGDWLPDAPSYSSPGCVVADGVIPAPGGAYQPFPAPLATAHSVTGQAKGARLLFRTDDTPLIVGGTATSLFTKDAAGAVNVTTGLGDVGNTRWQFAQFKTKIIAAGRANAVQYLSDIDTDVTWEPLPGDPPEARYVARVGEFVMLGDVGADHSRFQWSSFNAPGGDWTPSRRTQAGFAEAPWEMGRVVGMTGGRYPMIFQERGVSRLEYVGPPMVFRRETIDQARGCLAPDSIVQVGFQTFYLAQDGFTVTNGSQAQQIGSQKVNRWFFSTADPVSVKDVQGAVDWQNELVVWAFRSQVVSGYDRLLIFHWATGRWSSATVFTSTLCGAVIDGYTLEQVGQLYESLESVPISFDNNRWRGRLRGLGCFVDGATTTTLHTFSGSPLAARFETGEMEPQPGRRVFVSRGWPLVRTGAATIAATAVNHAGAETTAAPAAQGADGACPLRVDGRTVRLAVEIPAGADWSDAQGVQVDYRVSGRR